MAKKPDKAELGDSKKVNVEIAPLNGVRLIAHLRSINKHPDRSHPVITITDAINEAMDEFFVEAAEWMRTERPTAAVESKGVRKGGDHKKETKD